MIDPLTPKSNSKVSPTDGKIKLEWRACPQAASYEVSIQRQGARDRLPDITTKNSNAKPVGHRAKSGAPSTRSRSEPWTPSRTIHRLDGRRGREAVELHICWKSGEHGADEVGRGGYWKPSPLWFFCVMTGEGFRT